MSLNSPSSDDSSSCGSIRLVSCCSSFSPEFFSLSISAALPGDLAGPQSREIPPEQLNVTLSSCKSSSGVSCLFDGDLGTFWQSDGQIPHTAVLQASARFRLKAVLFYVHHTLDESYTPNIVQILVNGSDLLSVELSQPVGWVIIQFARSLRCKLAQLSIHAAHQNGRDSHIRQIKMVAEKRKQKENKNNRGVEDFVEPVASSSSSSPPVLPLLPEFFQSSELLQRLEIR